MSEMSLAVAVRFKQGSVSRDESLVEKLKAIFGKDADDFSEYDGVVEEINYESKNNDGFTANIVGKENVLYIDYIISQKRECYDINVNLTKEDLEKIVEKAKNLGILTEEYHIKILYYYNGGCAGLSEVV